MPRISTIPEVLELEPDVAVTTFKGTIKKIFSRKEGEGQFGKWSFEDLLVTDGANELKVNLKDRPPLDKNLHGKLVYFQASKNDHGWTGLKTHDEMYNGVKRRILRVTPTAEIVPAADLESGNPPPANEPARASATNQPAARQTQPQTQTSSTSATTEAQALIQTKVFIARRLTLMKIAAKAVAAFAIEFNASEESKTLGVKIDGDNFWHRVTTLYISAEAEGLAIRKGFADASPKSIKFSDLSIVEKGKTVEPLKPAAPPNPICEKCNCEIINDACQCPPDDVPF